MQTTDKERAGDSAAKTRRIGDLVLILVLLLIGLLSFFLIRALAPRGEVLEVRVDGVTVATYSLSEEGEYPILGGKNVLVIEDGAAYMKSADCPDKLCVGMGKIRRAGESVTCLPNRVVLVIVEAHAPDAVA